MLLGSFNAFYHRENLHTILCPIFSSDLPWKLNFSEYICLPSGYMFQLSKSILTKFTV